VAETPKALVQGTLDMLILKTLILEPMHGWGIGQRIEQISGGVFQVNPGSLFPSFRRMERQGLIRAEWRATENNRRAKYYTLTETGRRKLRSETREWECQAAAIARILRTSPGEI
jgi:PadR family transcriptional regulator, regulatory protein PadR